MPRGIPNVKAAQPLVVTPEEPAPLIFVEPAADGSIRLNAYGMSAGEVVDALRRVLISLHAQQAGVRVVSLEVPARAAPAASSPAAASPAAPARAKKTPPPRATNGRARQALRERFGEDVEVMSLSALGWTDEDD